MNAFEVPKDVDSGPSDTINAFLEFFKKLPSKISGVFGEIRENSFQGIISTGRYYLNRYVQLAKKAWHRFIN